MLNKLMKEKTKINRETRKIYNDLETNDEKINEFNKETNTFKKAIENNVSKFMRTFV